MGDTIDETQYNEETMKAIVWTRRWWGHSAGGSGTAARRASLKKSYGKILEEAGLEPYFVEKGLHGSRYDVRSV